MAWFKREEKGIQTATENKKNVPKGLWYKSPTGKIIDADELAKNFYVSPEDDYHVRIGSNEYFSILFDEGKYKELDKNLTSKDPLGFEDTKNISGRIRSGYELVRADEYKDSDYPVVTDGKYAGVIGVGGLVLARVPEEIAKSRTEYFAKQAEGQNEAVENDLMREEHKSMPINVDRQSRVTFGGTKK